MPILFESLKQQAIAHLREKLQQASVKLQISYPQPELLWKQRGVCAGSAWPERWQIWLNATLLMENQTAFIQEVVPHELAHLLVWRHFGRVAPHGKAWCWMMEEVLQVPAKRTHRFDVTSVLGETFIWHCQCQQHRLTRRRHQRAISDTAAYYCRYCKGKLQPGNVRRD